MDPRHLEREHEQIRNIFVEHQIALMQGRYDDARSGFDRFAALLRTHMEREEQEALVPYAEAAPHP
jgi:ATP-dependent protease HslVU (ClpYQ) peptidase subunit